MTETAPMRPDELEAVGEALFGSRWQTELGALLGVDSRRVRAWMAGERPVPAGVRSELAAALRARAKTAQRLADAIAP